MKSYYYALIGVIILFAGCGGGYDVSKTITIYGYDFTKYTANGFLFTPESYNGKYDAIGLIELSIYPEVRLNEGEKKYSTWDEQDIKWSIEKISASEVLDSLYKYSKRMGADAVVNLIISETEPRTNGEIVFKGTKVSGFAIKRK